MAVVVLVLILLPRESRRRKAYQIMLSMVVTLSAFVLHSRVRCLLTIDVFESAVCKVQLGNENDLTPEERAAIQHLLKVRDPEPEPTTNTDAPGSPGFLGKMNQKMEKIDAAAEMTGSAYVNLDFILASTAEIERIWSMAKYILVQQHRGMLPKRFECLLFLKYNRRFWNERMIVEAYRAAQESKRSARVSKMAEEYKAEMELVNAVIAALNI